MQTKLLFIFSIILLSLQISKAQNSSHFHYDYDASGNRVKREHIPWRIADTTQLADNIASHEIKIYPNPTSGALVVSIGDFSNITQSKIEIYDVTGRLVFKKETLNEFTNLDLTNEKSGNYFLKIFIDGKMKQWKVVKAE